MALTGKQKAAMLLSSLDLSTTTELLKDFAPETIKELAVELTYLNAAGHCTDQQTQAVTSEFYLALQQPPSFELKSFLDGMLKNTLGEKKAAETKSDIPALLKKKDPFLPARMASTPVLLTILQEEHPQAVAVILAELPPKQSSDILSQLPEGIRLSTISRMTRINTVTPEAKSRIGEMISTKLEAVSGPQDTALAKATPEQSIRKVAVVLRNLDTDLRNNVLEAVRDKDPVTADSVGEMMVVWDDIPTVSDRSMQAALRGIEEMKLALALHEMEGDIVQKIKGNISERAAAMVDEEAALMTAPKKNDVTTARETIVNMLRDLNNKGELMFEG